MDTEQVFADSVQRVLGNLQFDNIRLNVLLQQSTVELAAIKAELESLKNEASVQSASE